MEGYFPNKSLSYLCMHIIKPVLLTLRTIENIMLFHTKCQLKNTIERTIDLREYLAIFICDVSTELGHFQNV